jgi:hypothetical protein
MHLRESSLTGVYFDIFLSTPALLICWVQSVSPTLLFFHTLLFCLPGPFQLACKVPLLGRYVRFSSSNGLGPAVVLAQNTGERERERDMHAGKCADAHHIHTHKGMCLLLSWPVNIVQLSFSHMLLSRNTKDGPHRAYHQRSERYFNRS